MRAYAVEVEAAVGTSRQDYGGRGMEIIGVKWNGMCRMCTKGIVAEEDSECDPNGSNRREGEGKRSGKKEQHHGEKLAVGVL